MARTLEELERVIGQLESENEALRDECFRYHMLLSAWTDAIAHVLGDLTGSDEMLDEMYAQVEWAEAGD